jgi:hypothetical protein
MLNVFYKISVHGFISQSLEKVKGDVKDLCRKSKFVKM